MAIADSAVSYTHLDVYKRQEFDNWGAVMSVSEGLLCSFELLDPLDSAALKQVMKKGRQERKLANQQQQMMETSTINDNESQQQVY